MDKPTLKYNFQCSQKTQIQTALLSETKKFFILVYLIFNV